MKKILLLILLCSCSREVIERQPIQQTTMVIRSSGNLGLAVTNPSIKLHISGNIMEKDTIK